MTFLSIIDFTSEVLPDPDGPDTMHVNGCSKFILSTDENAQLYSLLLVRLYIRLIYPAVEFGWPAHPFD